MQIQGQDCFLGIGAYLKACRGPISNCGVSLMDLTGRAIGEFASIHISRVPRGRCLKSARMADFKRKSLGPEGIP
jgi:hypothetical protein